MVTYERSSGDNSTTPEKVGRIARHTTGDDKAVTAEVHIIKRVHATVAQGVLAQAWEHEDG